MNVIPFSFRIVFSNLSYIYIATVVAVVFWILFNTFDKLLFFSPVWTFYLPDDAVLGFILTNTSSILLGILISMNIYVIKQANLKVSKSSLLSGTTLGVLSSTCASCSSIGFAIISTLGGTGIAISNFLEVYAIPLRIISILILLYGLYLVHNKLTKSCVIQ